MNLRSFLCASALVLFCGMPAFAQDKTGDLKITFKLKGDIPELKDIDATTDKQFCGKQPVPNERLIVNKENKGIMNVVVYLYNNKRKGTELPEQPVPKRQLTLDNKNCRFEPHVLLTQVGDVLEIRNPDPVGHNANVQFFNIQENFQIPPGQSKKLELKDTEPSLMPISCSIHPWMTSHVLVVDHAFHGISNKDGVLEIKGIPVGKEVVFKAWHETGTFKEDIIVDGKEEEWKKNVVEFEIKPGMNDMGVVEVPVGNFSL